MRTITDASASSLMRFVQESVEPGAILHTDGWVRYASAKTQGYPHRVTVLSGRKESASELMPRLHRVASLVKRWLLGTHQGAVSREYLDYYLDEFTFRFNRRNSKSRGKLFYRLAQQAVALEPLPFKNIIAHSTSDSRQPQPVVAQGPKPE